jgi:hypothetical protein
MNTIIVTLEPHSDGTLHLPLPPELRQGRVRVTATLEPADTGLHGEAGELEALLAQIRKRNPFQSIADPVAWQQEIREDRSLPIRK